MTMIIFQYVKVLHYIGLAGILGVHFTEISMLSEKNAAKYAHKGRHF